MSEIKTSHHHENVERPKLKSDTCAFILGDCQYLKYCMGDKDFFRAGEVWQSIKNAYFEIASTEEIIEGKVYVSQSRMNELNSWNLKTQDLPNEVEGLLNCIKERLQNESKQNFDLVARIYAHALIYATRTWTINRSDIVLPLEWLHERVISQIEADLKLPGKWNVLERDENNNPITQYRVMNLSDDIEKEYVWMMSELCFNGPIKDVFKFLFEEGTNRPRIDKRVRIDVEPQCQGSDLIHLRALSILSPLLTFIFKIPMKFTILNFGHVADDGKTGFLANISVRIADNNAKLMEIPKQFSIEYMTFCELPNGKTRVTRFAKFTIPTKKKFLDIRGQIVKRAVKLNQKTLSYFEELKKDTQRNSKHGHSFSSKSKSDNECTYME